MYEFHGWLRSNSEEPIGELRDNTPGDDYDPIFVGYVNGTIHVSFSGNPNRDRGELNDILDYFLSGEFGFFGIVYINDSDADDYDKFRVLKISNDKVVNVDDSIFSEEELQIMFC
ncbi:hypothetical protein A9Q99_01165 [Gammaproteobacteria bacterium 45_16_T64]|nr:hypothetical protein A9Q99_01165 [Gammaproteobacteria bacterium 45_16_T64]